MGACRLLAERLDLPCCPRHLDDPELVCLRQRLADPGDGHRRARGDVHGDHLRRVHPVDVVGAEDDDIVRPFVLDQVEALVDGVGRAREPARPEPLLRRDRRHVVAQQGRHPPGLGDVPVQRVRLVLRQHDDLEIAGVDQVGEREVDQSVEPAEGDRRLRPVRRERHEPFAFATGEDDCEDFGSSHVSTLTSRAVKYQGRGSPRDIFPSWPNPSRMCPPNRQDSFGSMCSPANIRLMSMAAPGSTWSTSSETCATGSMRGSTASPRPARPARRA